MAICYQFIRETGTGRHVLEPVSTDIATCESQGGDTVALTNADYQALLLSQTSQDSSGTNVLTVDDLFSPQALSPSDYNALFTFFFTTPLIVYLVAWAYQQVISFAAKDDM